MRFLDHSLLNSQTQKKKYQFRSYSNYLKYFTGGTKICTYQTKYGTLQSPFWFTVSNFKHSQTKTKTPHGHKERQEMSNSTSVSSSGLLFTKNPPEQVKTPTVPEGKLDDSDPVGTHSCNKHGLLSPQVSQVNHKKIF